VNVSPSVCSDLCATYYSSLGGTTSGIAACATADDDVWFEFTAINPNTTIKVLGSGNYDPTVELFSGTTQIACGNTVGSGLSETINTTTLVVGQQYFVRVYHRGSGSGSNSSSQFSLCVSGTPIPPSNDECVNKISLPITSSGTYTTGTLTVAASPSPGIPVCSVAGTTPDDDVWYAFTATNNFHVITVVGNTGFNAVIQLFSGTCGSLTAIGCVNNYGNGQTENLFATTLNANSTYYIRIYHAGLGGGSGSYSIGVSSPPPDCSTMTLPPNGEIDMSISETQFFWDASIGASTYRVYLDTINPPVKLKATTSDTSILAGMLKGNKTYYWKVQPGNTLNYNTTCPVTSFTTEPTPVTLTVRAYLEAFYSTTNHNMNPFLNPADTLTDTVTIDLIDSNNEVLYSQTTLLSINGWTQAYFPLIALDNEYYLAVKHRNHVEVWTNSLFYFTGDSTFDFTQDSASAFGDNMVELETGVYGLNYGDVNQDGSVDSTDLSLVGVSASLFETGYVSTDLNGDHMVESIDYCMIENELPFVLQRRTPFSP
jgi:hypothetical protein